MAAGATAKEINDEVSKRWQALDAEQKRPWEEKFEHDQKRYQVKHPATERRRSRHLATDPCDAPPHRRRWRATRSRSLARRMLNDDYVV